MVRAVPAGDAAPRPEGSRSTPGPGLDVLGVLSDDTVSQRPGLRAQYGATWPSVFDATGAIKTAYQVIGRPQSYFVDADGILRSIQIGYLTDADFERQFAMISGGRMSAVAERTTPAVEVASA